MNEAERIEIEAACYRLVPGVVRFYDAGALTQLVERQGLTVVECDAEPSRTTIVARHFRSEPADDH